MAESDFDIRDDRFRKCIRTSARLDHLYQGTRWAEGPAYIPAWRHLVWSDVPNDRMMRWDEVTGAVSVFRSPSHYSNGNTVDREGRLITCEHGTRRVTRLEHDGSTTVLADRYEGKRFNSPNDVVVKSDGSIWFTDPSYGIDSNYEGYRAESEIGSCNVYRLDSDGSLHMVNDDFVQPNGLAFSPDERLLYIADSGVSHVPGHPRHIRALNVSDDNRLSGGDVFAETTDGVFDGFRVDENGHVWAGATSGVHCYTPEGELLGIIRVPERVANVAFGGVRRNRLFIAGTTSLYAMLLPVSGVKTF